ncbi:hypothetical protein HDV00_009670 [Rhizophlyctis rosea]|nr:hypothetical protein HDV00_009670 [Rhizophlyctis rosea]
MRTLLHDKQSGDVTILIETGGESQLFKADRSVLAVRCPYFKAMFSTDGGKNWAEADTNTVRLKDLPLTGVRKSLEYLYTGVLDVSDNIAQCIELYTTLQYLLLDVPSQHVIDHIEEQIGVMDSTSLIPIWEAIQESGADTLTSMMIRILASKLLERKVDLRRQFGFRQFNQLLVRISHVGRGGPPVIEDWSALSEKFGDEWVELYQVTRYGRDFRNIARAFWKGNNEEKVKGIENLMSGWWESKTEIESKLFVRAIGEYFMRDG